MQEEDAFMALIVI